MTVSEIDNLEFNLYRGVAPDVPDTQLNATLIPSQAPGSSMGASYSWSNTAEPGTPYYYWLEDVDLNGTTTREGPISAVCGSPTAVTMRDFGTEQRSQAGLTWWAVVVALALAMVPAALVRRRV